MIKEIKRCRQLYSYTENSILAVGGMFIFLLLGSLFVFGGGRLYFYEPLYFCIAFNMVKRQFFKIGTSGLGATSPFYKTMMLKVSNIWMATVNFLSYIILAVLLFVCCKLRSRQPKYMDRLWRELEFSKMLLAAAVILALGSVFMVVNEKYYGISILTGIVLLFVLNKNIEKISGVDMTGFGAFLAGIVIVAAGSVISMMIQKLLYRKPFSRYVFDRPNAEKNK